jgi:hypothetical protein
MGVNQRSDDLAGDICLVELRGFEPLTSCMPYLAGLSEAVADLAVVIGKVHGIAVLSEAVGVSCGCQG